MRSSSTQSVHADAPDAATSHGQKWQAEYLLLLELLGSGTGNIASLLMSKKEKVRPQWGELLILKVT